MGELKICQDKPFYHFVMIGSEGVEGYRIARDEAEITPEFLTTMEFRARMNSQRNVHGWAFAFPSKVPADKITEELLKNLKATEIF